MLGTSRCGRVERGRGRWRRMPALWPKCPIANGDGCDFRRAPLLFGGGLFLWLGVSRSRWALAGHAGVVLGPRCCWLAILVVALAVREARGWVRWLAGAAVWGVVRGCGRAEVRPEPDGSAPAAGVCGWAEPDGGGAGGAGCGCCRRLRRRMGTQDAVGWWETDGADPGQAVTGATRWILPCAAGGGGDAGHVNEMVPVEGGVRATLIADGRRWPELQCGDRGCGTDAAAGPGAVSGSGGLAVCDYLLEQGIGARDGAGSRLARARKVAAADCGGGMGGDGRAGCLAAQAWAAGRMARYVRSGVNRHVPRWVRLSADDAGMLSAMLFGDRSALSHRQRLGFERTGSFHLFVVSGMHVALVAGGLFWLGRRLRWPAWLATVVTLLVTTGYALVTGFGVPVQRALWMTAVFLVARLLSRENSIANAVGAAALAVLVWAPAALFEASFQMTFLAMVAIVGIASPLGEQTFRAVQPGGSGAGRECGGMRR